MRPPGGHGVMRESKAPHKPNLFASLVRCENSHLAHFMELKEVLRDFVVEFGIFRSVSDAVYEVTDSQNF